MRFLTRYPKVMAVCLSAVFSILLTGCNPKDHLSGDWKKINDDDCESLCSFMIEEDRITGKLTLTFDNDKDLTEKPVEWELRLIARKNYRLILENGNDIDFTVQDGNLVMRGNEVYEKQ